MTMEFERSIFRIHQRTLACEPLRRLRVRGEQVLPWITGFLVLWLYTLHVNYVGQHPCLAPALRRAGLWNSSSGVTKVPVDLTLKIVLTDGVSFSDEGFSLQQEPGAGRGAHEGGIAGGRVEVVNENVTMDLPADAPFDVDTAVASYMFAFDREILAMRETLLDIHNFPVRNVTIPLECVASSSIMRTALRVFDWWDNIIINEIAYTFRSRGHVQRQNPGTGSPMESWGWTQEQVEETSPEVPRNLVVALLRKLVLVFNASFSFMLVSAITGLFIRLAVNGSAALMFPMAMIMHRFGTSHVDGAILVRSFPWIGVYVEVLRRANKPLFPLFLAHLAFLGIMSFAYLACNLAWRVIIYQKSMPQDFEEQLFSLCSALELFNLIFVRSMKSASLFPRLACAAVVYTHYYIFASLYPFHSLALVTTASFLFYVMFFCLNNYEEPSLLADPFSPTTPTYAHPRALYMPQLSPSWTVESAPLWTMFYPPDPPQEYNTEAMRSITAEEHGVP